MAEPGSLQELLEQVDVVLATVGEEVGRSADPAETYEGLLRRVGYSRSAVLVAAALLARGGRSDDVATEMRECGEYALREIARTSAT